MNLNENYFYKKKIERLKMEAKEFLKKNLLENGVKYFGNVSMSYLECVVNQWMDDDNIPKCRFKIINYLLPNANKILDMASGCGAAVFYGLKSNYDMYGIEPEEWKNEFIKIKAKENNYPDEWIQRFYKGVGESLPFPNDFFDCVMSNQTLEHVEDVYFCINEMIRVCKSGGGVHLNCPDYRGTFEGHYMLPWLPLFPKFLAKMYLKMLNKPTLGIDYINYTTKPQILKILQDIKKNNPSIILKIIDLKRTRRPTHILERILPYCVLNIINYFRICFKSGISINLFIYIKK